MCAVASKKSQSRKRIFWEPHWVLPENAKLAQYSIDVVNKNLILSRPPRINFSIKTAQFLLRKYATNRAPFQDYSNYMITEVLYVNLHFCRCLRSNTACRDAANTFQIYCASELCKITIYIMIHLHDKLPSWERLWLLVGRKFRTYEVILSHV